MDNRFSAQWRETVARIPSHKFMTVLKSKLSGFYFKAFGVWTSDPLDALAFPDEWLARHFLRREQVQDVQIVEPEVATSELVRSHDREFDGEAPEGRMRRQQGT